MKKYEFTEDYIVKGNKRLHRIRALRSFKGVERGDLGGYIQSEYNLSHNGNAWVGNDAKVYELGSVCENGCVTGTSEIRGFAEVHGNASITGYSVIGGNSVVTGDAWLLNYVRPCGQAVIAGDAWIKESRDVLEVNGIRDADLTATAFRIRGGGIGFVYSGYYGSPEEFTRYAEYQCNDVLRGQLLKFIELAKISFGYSND